MRGVLYGERMTGVLLRAVVLLLGLVGAVRMRKG